MTDDMLALARRNQAEAGVENVTFLAGEIEAIPLPDRSVDVVISNCVINLSADKDRVLREAFRVLRPGGLFAVSDMVLTKPLPDALRRSAELWAGCVSGALLESEYRDKLAAAGFQSIEIVPTRVFGACDVDALRSGSCCSVELTDGEGHQLDLAALDGALISAFVRARRLP
jgi:SAM-dependent methyltransferase